jgi:hypothetical protein
VEPRDDYKLLDERVGDSVTPIIGVFAGQRFIVMERRVSEEFGTVVEVRIRPYPARQGGPSPLWVPVNELLPFFSPRMCPICGDSGHQRCEPPDEFPQVGWRVEAMKKKIDHADGDLVVVNGDQGTVVRTDEIHRIIVVEFDHGTKANWRGERLRMFFDDVEVL